MPKSQKNVQVPSADTLAKLLPNEPDFFLRISKTKTVYLEWWGNALLVEVSPEETTFTEEPNLPIRII